MLNMNLMNRIMCAAVLGLMVAGAARADLDLGLVSDFNDGTLQDWNPPKGNTSNAGGFLQVFPAPQLAAFNANVTGNIGPGVTGLSVDLMRPDGEADLEMRFVLFGPGTSNRWTSTLAQVLPGDGAWHSYNFSVLEADLTRVAGIGTYADLAGGLDRIMFRNDTGTPSTGGSSGFDGTFGMDNVVAVPEPASLALLGLGGVAMMRRKHIG